jgi:hypothetical protein
MPSIDDGHIHLIHEVMSRPFRFVLPAVFLAGAFGISGCVGTLYDETYSYNKNHFKPPKEEHGKEASAEAILGALEPKTPATGADTGASAGLPPAGDIPGLPAPAAPAAPDAAAAPAPPAPPAVPPPK